MAVVQRRHDALRGGLRLEQDRRLRHARRSRTDTFDPAALERRLHRRERRRPAGLAARRGATIGSTCYTRFDNGISMIDLGTAARDRRTRRSTTPSRPRVVDGPPLPLRRASRPRATARRRARAATSSATSTARLGPRQSRRHLTVEPDVDQARCRPGADLNGAGDVDEFHPMKGPMTTQTLRGMASTAAPCTGAATASNGFFGHGRRTTRTWPSDNFIVAFEGLVGRDGTPLRPPTCRRSPTSPCSSACRRTRCATSTTRSPPTSRPAARTSTSGASPGRTCVGRLAIGGTRQPQPRLHLRRLPHPRSVQGFFGTNGDASFENEPQIVKIAHLRNLYQKVGMFGMPTCRSSTR